MGVYLQYFLPALEAPTVARWVDRSLGEAEECGGKAADEDDGEDEEQRKVDEHLLGGDTRRRHEEEA